MSLKIFVVEDDAWYGEVLKCYLELNPDYQVAVMPTGKACLDNLHLCPDVVCIDFGLPDMDGTRLFSCIRLVNKQVPVIVISGQEEVAIALDLMKMGVSDYLLKNDDTRELLWASLLRIRETGKANELKQWGSRRRVKQGFLVGGSRAMQGVLDLVHKVAESNINVSISGETGTGKEQVAKAIHAYSARGKKPFVCLNMAAIPFELMESELFGHEKGAFTGAISRRIGKFEEAHGGTIFLDEITELDLSMQVKLLRVLQEREVCRLGGTDVHKLDIRVITAANKDIWAEVNAGRFREDLYYRIMGIPIKLPALRERVEDIGLLAGHFIQEFAAANNMPEPELSEEALYKLMRYNYPGNVRELKTMIELACVMSNGIEIQAGDVCFPANPSRDTFLTLEKTLDEHIIDIIKFYLKKYDDRVTVVADKLHIGRSTIYNLLKKNGITV